MFLYHLLLATLSDFAKEVYHKNPPSQQKVLNSAENVVGVLVESCINDAVVTLAGKLEGVTSYLDNFPMVYIIALKTMAA